MAAEVLARATQRTGFQAQALGQAVGQGVLRIGLAARSGQVVEQRRAGQRRGKRSQSVHGGVPGQDI